MKKAFVIIRVSGEDQLKGYGPDVQWEDDVMPNAPLLGLEVDEANRRVIQESATGWERAKFEAKVREALALYHQGKIEAILFPRVDRETRFVFGSFTLLVEVIKSGLEVYFGRDKFRLDPNDPESVEKYFAKATRAQADAATIRENTMRGKRKRVKLKKKLPTGRGVLYGYDYDKQQERNMANACLENVRMMGVWVLEERIYLNEVCRRLMERGILAPKGGLVWSRGTVGRILRNSAHAGKTYAGKTKIVDGKRVKCPQDEWVEIPDAVDKTAFTWDEWEGIQRQLDRNQEENPRNQKLSYLLRSMVYCKRCGRKYHGVPVHHQPYYRCSGRNRLVSVTPCSNKTMNARWLEDTVWSEIEAIFAKPELILAELRRQMESGDNTTHLEEQIAQLDKLLETQEKALTRYLRMYGGGLYSEGKLEYEVARTKAEQKKSLEEKDELNNRLKLTRQQQVSERNIERMLTLVSSKMKNLDYEDKKLAFEALDIKIWIDGESVMIEGFIPAPDADIVSLPS